MSHNIAKAHTFTRINIHTHVHTQRHVQIHVHMHKYTHQLWNMHLWACKSCLLDIMEEWASGSVILLLFFIDKHIYSFPVPNWLCNAELHLWIIWHISCYFFDRSTQRKFQGTFLLTSRNINIWINCRFGSPYMDALQKERGCVCDSVFVCACFCVSEGNGKGFVSFCYHGLIPPSPQAEICMQHFIRRELDWVTCEEHFAVDLMKFTSLKRQKATL